MLLLIQANKAATEAFFSRLTRAEMINWLWRLSGHSPSHKVVPQNEPGTIIRGRFFNIFLPTGFWFRFHRLFQPYFILSGDEKRSAVENKLRSVRSEAQHSLQ